MTTVVALLTVRPATAADARANCGSCALFRHRGQYAVMFPLFQARQSGVPLTSLHG